MNLYEYCEYIAQGKRMPVYQFNIDTRGQSVKVIGSKNALDEIRPAVLAHGHVTSSIFPINTGTKVYEDNETDLIDVPAAWEITDKMTEVFSLGGRVISLGAMTPDMLQSFITEGQKNLKAVDEQIKEVATKIANNPSTAENHVNEFRELYKNQRTTESRLERILTELERRDKEVKRKDWLRTANLTPALVSQAEPVVG